MKAMFILLFSSYLNLITAQNRCESSGQIVLDINAIEISKCAIETTSSPTSSLQTTKKAQKTSIQHTYSRKKIHHRFNKINTQKASFKKVPFNNSLPKINTDKQTPSLQKEILFVTVDEPPLFPNCKYSTKEKNIQCFKSSINKHFNQNFNYERFSEITTKDKIFIRFTIDIKGNVKKTQILSSNENKILTNEINRVLLKLPQFSAGKYKGVPVNVTYTFSINLTLT
ncbi:energy transducer TonB [Tenacibaculum maritimum]